MYIYTMERTQIYLSKAQTAALDSEARRTGTTRSHLIREAIDARYGEVADPERIRRALQASAGLWRDRARTGEAYVEQLRSGRRLRDAHSSERDPKPG